MTKHAKKAYFQTVTAKKVVNHLECNQTLFHL